jgi:hypothetical protein
MNEPMTMEREKRGGSSGAAHGSADNLRLSNDAKIRACNFFHAMQKHMGDCDECCLYLYHGDGDLCESGKTILARELVYTDMSIASPPNS